MGIIQKKWKIGDSVVTIYSGKSTAHTVSDVRDSVTCGKEQMVRVGPMVPTSDGLYAWLNANWFLENNA